MLSIGLQNLGVEVQFRWVPGPRDIPHNELADLAPTRQNNGSSEHLKDLHNYEAVPEGGGGEEREL